MAVGLSSRSFGGRVRRIESSMAQVAQFATILPFEELSASIERPVVDFDSAAASLAADPLDGSFTPISCLASDGDVPYISSQRHSDGRQSLDAESGKNTSNRVGIVAPGVLIASYRSISDPIVREQYNIGALLCTAAELVDTIRPPHLAHLPHLSIALRDTAEEDLKTAVNSAVSFITEQRAQGRTVAIYCYAGLSRSVAIALGYLLMTSPTRSVDAALKDLRSRYPVAEPNLFFLQQLVELSRC